MRILRGQSNLEVSSKGFALFVVGLVLATFLGGALKTALSSDQVHSRIVAELKTHFPKQEFQMGQTEVLLARGLWPALGLRIHNLTFRQEVCGKLSFELSIPVAILPLDIFSLAGNRTRLNDVEIDGGELHLDYHDCPTKPQPAGPPAKAEEMHKPLSAPRFDWVAIGEHLDGIELKNFAVTYEKNPTWKLLFDSAYMSFGHELKSRAQVEVQKSLPFGTLVHPVTLDLQGEGNVLQWNFHGEFKEGRMSFAGSLDTALETATAKVNIRQVPIKDFMSELFEMGVVEHDLKLKATWLSCSAGWAGQLKTYTESPINLHDCRVEGGYGRAELAGADLWLSGQENFRPPAHLKITRMELQPLAEALNRSILPAVISHLGLWSGDFTLASAAAWQLDGQLENTEVIFVNQSTHGKQVIDRVHTRLAKAEGKIHGVADDLHLHEGEFAGQVQTDLESNWRDGDFRAHIERLQFSPAIQRLLVGGSMAALSGEGEAQLQGGELKKWNGNFSLSEIRGEGWRAAQISMHTSFSEKSFLIDSSVRQVSVDSGWHFFSELRQIWPDVPNQVTWKDLTSKVEILKTGGKIQSVVATETEGRRVWRSRGVWVRDGEFNGLLNIGQGKHLQSYNLLGEKGELSLEEQIGQTR